MKKLVTFSLSTGARSVFRLYELENHHRYISHARGKMAARDTLNVKTGKKKQKTLQEFIFVKDPAADTANNDGHGDNFSPESTDAATNSGHGDECSTPQEHASVSSAAGSKSRTFQVKWLQEYKWLSYEDGKMLCQLCIKADKANSFTKGSSNFRTSNLKEHLKTADHRLAVQVPILQKNQERVMGKMLNDRECAILVAMKTVHWLASQDVALMKYKSLMSLFKDLDVPYISHLAVSENVQYESSDSVLEFLEAMSQYVENEHVKALQSSPYVSVLADESTDIAVRKRLVIYAQVIDPINMSPNTLFLTNVELQEATGAGIAAAIFNELQERGVPQTKIMSLGSDGASVMTGILSG